MRMLVVGLSVVLLLGVSVAGSPAAEPPSASASGEVVAKPARDSKPPVREVMLRALKLAVEARGLTVAEGSLAKGNFTTAFLPMDPALIPKAIRLPPGHAPVERAEYRYRIQVGGRHANLVSVSAEIRTWPPLEPAPAEPGQKKPRSASTRYLEREFQIAFGREVDKLAHLLPAEDPDEKPASGPKARTTSDPNAEAKSGPEPETKKD